MAKDHLGNEFKTIQEMCDFYQIKKRTYSYRIKQGWSVEKALTTPAQTITDIKEITDTYPDVASIHALCEGRTINSATVYRRLKKGLSLEEIFDDKNTAWKSVNDSSGNELAPNISAFCKEHHISRMTFRKLKAEGWTNEKIANAKTGCKTEITKRFGDKYEIIRLFAETPKNIYWLCKDRETEEERIMTYTMLEEGINE